MGKSRTMAMESYGMDNMQLNDLDYRARFKAEKGINIIMIILFFTVCKEKFLRVY